MYFQKNCRVEDKGCYPSRSTKNPWMVKRIAMAARRTRQATRRLAPDIEPDAHQSVVTASNSEDRWDTILSSIYNLWMGTYKEGLVERNRINLIKANEIRANAEALKVQVETQLREKKRQERAQRREAAIREARRLEEAIREERMREEVRIAEEKAKRVAEQKAAQLAKEAKRKPEASTSASAVQPTVVAAKKNAPAMERPQYCSRCTRLCHQGYLIDLDKGPMVPVRKRNKLCANCKCRLG
jgi:hypothetical protein